MRVFPARAVPGPPASGQALRGSGKGKEAVRPVPANRGAIHSPRRYLCRQAVLRGSSFHGRRKRDIRDRRKAPDWRERETKPRMGARAPVRRRETDLERAAPVGSRRSVPTRHRRRAGKPRLRQRNRETRTNCRHTPPLPDRACRPRRTPRYSDRRRRTPPDRAKTKIGGTFARTCSQAGLHRSSDKTTKRARSWLQYARTAGSRRVMVGAGRFMSVKYVFFRSHRPLRKNLESYTATLSTLPP